MMVTQSQSSDSDSDFSAWLQDSNRRLRLLLLALRRMRHLESENAPPGDVYSVEEPEPATPPVPRVEPAEPARNIFRESYEVRPADCPKRGDDSGENTVEPAPTPPLPTRPAERPTTAVPLILRPGTMRPAPKALFKMPAAEPLMIRPMPKASFKMPAAEPLIIRPVPKASFKRPAAEPEPPGHTSKATRRPKA